ncbi:sigma 54-interacting transcriptional regulator [Pseudoxanthomonas suwonensis]|uniref:Fis family transcriptional regulator n=1 Tax=Pseudoxanthomonas suwonensis TaxID=314722 RepID=A0A0E3Z3L4_9GAMM|nr:sigma 54-interacting transcriptional regulator [Pseudoxanthomonas suwonensis]AKC86774.1 Fis family transcriptional regulator [Pseudoxanthomonas suwonensis]
MQTGALPNLIGQSEVFLRAVGLIERMARFDAPVLIQGETGTGKELAARAIHYLSSRQQAPFVALNCGAMPEGLIETELFGCERGAFTDARQARTGLVAAADGGTFFLDELDSLPLRAQVSLLRFLQDKTYRPVGSMRVHCSDVRVIAAASPRLQEMLVAGAFRDDLAFRLNVLMLEMPPLRERGTDALLLAEYFIERHASHYGVAPRHLDARSREWATRYPWPGNVRELDNLIQRALLLSDGKCLDFSLHAAEAGVASPPGMPPPGRPPSQLQSYSDARAQAMSSFERHYLEHLMTAAAGNVTRAARLAGKERRALGKLLKKHGLDHASFHEPAHA